MEKKNLAIINLPSKKIGFEKILNYKNIKSFIKFLRIKEGRKKMKILILTNFKIIINYKYIQKLNLKVKYSRNKLKIYLYIHIYIYL